MLSRGIGASFSKCKGWLLELGCVGRHIFQPKPEAGASENQQEDVLQSTELINACISVRSGLRLIASVIAA